MNIHIGFMKLHNRIVDFRFLVLVIEHSCLLIDLSGSGKCTIQPLISIARMELDMKRVEQHWLQNKWIMPSSHLATHMQSQKLWNYGLSNSLLRKWLIEFWISKMSFYGSTISFPSKNILVSQFVYLRISKWPSSSYIWSSSGVTDWIHDNVIK